MANGMGPESSALRVDSNLEKKLEGASHAEILQALHDAALQQGLVQLDPYSGDPLPTEKAFNNPDAKSLTRVLSINGTRYELSGRDENELNEAEISLHRQLQNPPEQEQARDANGRFVSQQDTAADAARRADLELKFKRGELSTEDYLAESGAIDRYLESQGVSMQGLRETAGRGFVKSWESATQEFLRSPDGQSWPGGDANMKVVAEILEANGFIDAEDKSAAIAAAVRFARENNLLDENTREVQSARAAQEIGTAMNVEEIRELGRRSMGLPASSGVFGGR